MRAEQTVEEDLLRSLSSLATANEVECALIACSKQTVDSSVAARAVIFKELRDIVASLRSERDLILPDENLWSHYLPLVELLLEWPARRRTRIIGMTGAPGTGKSTIALIICTIANFITRRKCISVSLDDFYLTPDERKAKGFKWRGGPGTHDLNLIDSFVSQFDSSTLSRVRVPQYDRDGEKRLPELIVEEPLELILIEGWWLGGKAPGYEALNSLFDKLVYLDVDIELARKWRIERESRIREESNGLRGMNEKDVTAFWNEILEPGIRTLLPPVKDKADLILRLNEKREIVSAVCP